MYKIVLFLINKIYGKCVKRVSLILRNVKGLFIVYIEAIIDWEKRCYLIFYILFVF